jgi:radical SAM superfamily enzyme
MYKDEKFVLRPYEEIELDITIADKVFPNRQTIFIGDSDSLVHKDILKIIKLIKKTFPHITRITSYARAHTLARKGIEKLKALREAGLTRVHVGLESGDAEILNYLKKGANPEIMIEGGCKAKEAGLEVCFYILCGAGGEFQWKQHAQGSARIINAVNPDFIRLRTLSLIPNAPLYKKWQEGEFQPISPLSRLKETKKLIELLNVIDCRLASDHVTNYLWGKEGIVFEGVKGKLPEDKKTMIEVLDKTIKEIKNKNDITDTNFLVQRGIITRL